MAKHQWKKFQKINQNLLIEFFFSDPYNFLFENLETDFNDFNLETITKKANVEITFYNTLENWPLRTLKNSRIKETRELPKLLS